MPFRGSVGRELVVHDDVLIQRRTGRTAHFHQHFKAAAVERDLAQAGDRGIDGVVRGVRQLAGNGKGFGRSGRGAVSEPGVPVRSDPADSPGATPRERVDAHRRSDRVGDGYRSVFSDCHTEVPDFVGAVGRQHGR